MDLNVQNKAFLSVLSRLDIDVKQFPDKTFDGLFENVPEITNYFFNWFIENISPDNGLTQSEQATYFHLQSTDSLPTEEEMNYVLSSCSPAYEELKCLDINYADNYISVDLDDLKKNYEGLSGILTDINTNFSNVKRKQNCLKEELNNKRKELSAVKKDCYKMNSYFGCKIDEVKMLLLKELHFRLDLDFFKKLIAEEENIFDKFTSKLLEHKGFSNTKFDLLPELKEDLTCVEISAVLSEGFYRMKKERIDLILELLQKKALQKNLKCNFIQPYFVVNEEENIKLMEEVKNLETELFEKIRLIAINKVQQIAGHYLLNKIDLNKSYLVKITDFKNSMQFNSKLNSCLLHILIRNILIMENILELRKELYFKLIQYETNFSNDLTTLELRSQRYKEVSNQQNQHPLLTGLKNIMNYEVMDPENSEETWKNLSKMMLCANDDSNFIPFKFRNALQSSVKMLLDKTLCGPTNQLLFVPIELLIKFQECKERENNLSQVVKRLASKYVGAKDTISKSDRSKLLLWLKVFTDPQCLLTEICGSPS